MGLSLAPDVAPHVGMALVYACAHPLWSYPIADGLTRLAFTQHTARLIRMARRPSEGGAHPVPRLACSAPFCLAAEGGRSRCPGLRLARRHGSRARDNSTEAQGVVLLHFSTDMPCREVAAGVAHVARPCLGLTTAISCVAADSAAIFSNNAGGGIDISPRSYFKAYSRARSAIISLAQGVVSGSSVVVGKSNRLLDLQWPEVAALVCNDRVCLRVWRSGCSLCILVQ